MQKNFYRKLIVMRALEEITRGCASWRQFGTAQWAIKNGCRLHRHISRSAAGNGHLGVLQWAIKHGYEWDIYVCGVLRSVLA